MTDVHTDGYCWIATSFHTTVTVPTSSHTTVSQHPKTTQFVVLGCVFVDVWGVVPVGSGLGLALDLRLDQGLEGLSNLPPLNRAPDRTALFWPIHKGMAMHAHRWISLDCHFI